MIICLISNLLQIFSDPLNKKYMHFVIVLPYVVLKRTSTLHHSMHTALLDIIERGTFDRHNM